MKPSRVTSPVLRFGLMVMCAIWTVSGWYVIAARSFSTKPIRSTVVTTVDGPGAVFAGTIFVVLGLIALAVLLQGSASNKATRVGLIGLLFVIPAVFVLAL
jgi:hypothetical protein